MAPSVRGGPSPIVALLGPTNTGKTYRSIERMLEHETGMIGLPLRLLAREVYDRVTTKVGENRVALVTGEEKRIPALPSYWICTVESMPVDLEVDFVAVDEIQLAAHARRGHVFSDRLLRARGLRESWFMGSETMRSMVEQLLPTAEIRTHPRLSTLSAEGAISLSNLPARSAIVAFSASQVYDISEKVRQRKGGAAVVLGSLSPRTRNAQVALYQSGEVDYIVATDAIGMGLNLDIDHVAFAGLQKYDGNETRLLEPAELAQIAGRAGRYMNHGSFGTLVPVPALPLEIARAIETHQFRSVKQLVWRNGDLDTSSLENLIASLRQKPRQPHFRLVARADDFDALCFLSEQPDIRSKLGQPEAVALLWEVCQIPDFGDHPVEFHAKTLAELFLQLCGPSQSVDPRWLADSVDRIDNTEGSIDTLMMRIEHIRTWTYISHHAGWLRHAKKWQARTQEIEERLSDALHERLVARFVERGGKGRARAKAHKRVAPPDAPSGRVGFDHPFEKLLEMNLPLKPTPQAPPSTQQKWARTLVDAGYGELVCDERGVIVFQGQPVARMTRGADLLRPEVRLLWDGELGAGGRLQVQRRLLAFTRDMVDEMLGSLRRGYCRDLSPAGKGLIYQLEQGLGTVWADVAREQVRGLTRHDRELMRRMDVYMGYRLVFVRGLLKPGAVRARLALCAAYYDLRLPTPELYGGNVSVKAASGVTPVAYLAIGYPVFGPRAIRADVVERVGRRLYQLSRKGSFGLAPELGSWLGCSAKELALIVRALGYRRTPEGLYQELTDVPLPRSSSEPEPIDRIMAALSS
jgi:ATP-dependent RNA helicase SUPV3L1/SUV3